MTGMDMIACLRVPFAPMRRLVSRRYLTDSWISKTGTYYALVALDVEKFSDAVNRMDQLSESVRRAVVERAEESFLEMNEEIERERQR